MHLVSYIEGSDLTPVEPIRGIAKRDFIKIFRPYLGFLFRHLLSWDFWFLLFLFLCHLHPLSIFLLL